MPVQVDKRTSLPPHNDYSLESKWLSFCDSALLKSLVKIIFNFANFFLNKIFSKLYNIIYNSPHATSFEFRLSGFQSDTESLTHTTRQTKSMLSDKCVGLEGSDK